MTAASVQDKRAHLRFPSSRPVVMIINNKSIYATMTDFSRNGIGFISSETPEVYSRIEIHFDVAEADQNQALHTFQFKAEVKHCISLNQENHIGVKIEVPSAEYTNLFDTLTAA